MKYNFSPRFGSLYEGEYQRLAHELLVDLTKEGVYSSYIFFAIVNEIMRKSENERSTYN